MSATASGYDPELALRLAKLSALAYRNKAEIAETLHRDGFGSVAFFDFEGTMGFLATGNSRSRDAVLAFRGTREDFADILSDINFLPRLATDDHFPAHGGFVKAILGVWGTNLQAIPGMTVSWVGAEGVSNALARLPENVPLYITGHSLGGALATLACFKSRRPPTALYTFGCPRVGAKAFARELDRRLPRRMFRVVNCVDIVPRVPIAPFRHCGTLIYFDWRGRRYDAPGAIGGIFREVAVLFWLLLELLLWWLTLKTFRAPRISVFGDHRIAEYIRKVESDATRAPGRSPS